MIELKPHTGIHMATKQTVDLGQDRVFVNGRGIGYVGRVADAPIMLVEPCDEATQRGIAELVRQTYGGSAGVIRVAPGIPEEAEDEDDPEDEDYDD